MREYERTKIVPAGLFGIKVSHETKVSQDKSVS